MNVLKKILSTSFLSVAMMFTACGDKVTPVLVEQGERLNSEMQTLVEENPQLFNSISAEYADNCMSVDVKLADSLFVVSQIPEPLFNYFTAYEIKNHLDKNLEITVNALSEKEAPLVVTLTDAFGDSRKYEFTPALLRRMVKSSLAQLDFNEAREALWAIFSTSKELFRPEIEGPVKEYTTSFKGGFFDYIVVFDKARSYSGLKTANLKSRALKVFDNRYAKLGTMRPVLFGMYKSLGLDGFHLVYSAGEDSQSLKTTITLTNILNSQK